MGVNRHGGLNFPLFFGNLSFNLKSPNLQHPIELVKTRMQLQGELTQTYKKTYSKNLASAKLIIKTDGFSGLYGGLRAGLSYQIVMNGTRLTIFDQLKELGIGSLAFHILG